MSPSNPQSRQRIVAGAADMIRRRGLHATSIREVAKHAHAPLGSTYHYFPGGKQQLVTEAIHYAGDTVATLLRDELEAGPIAGLRGFLALWRETLTSTGYQAGCPVLGVAIEEGPGDDSATARTAAAEVFTTWQTLLADALRRHGIPEQQAGQLATTVIAATEGAIALCRAQHDTAPLDDVATQLEALVTTALSR